MPVKHFLENHPLNIAGLGSQISVQPESEMNDIKLDQLSTVELNSELPMIINSPLRPKQRELNVDGEWSVERLGSPSKNRFAPSSLRHDSTKNILYGTFKKVVFLSPPKNTRALSPLKMKRGSI